MHTLAPPDFWQEQKWDFAIAIHTYLLEKLWMRLACLLFVTPLSCAINFKLLT